MRQNTHRHPRPLVTRGRILAVDKGSVRVGLAISDESCSIAFPLEVIPAKGASEAIAKLCAEREITRVIVGLPITMKGEIGPEARRVQKFLGTLRRAIPKIPIDTVDERFSSLAADRILDSGKGDPRRDAVAASIMLESYLKKIQQDGQDSQDQFVGLPS